MLIKLAEPARTAAPAATFAQPFEMLAACHERVHRSLDLLARLYERVRQQRIDQAVRDAARDVLRYFDIAAPHHHEDEERHVFPRLLAMDEAGPAVHEAVHELMRQHEAMRAQWAVLRRPLERLAGGEDDAFDAAALADAARFAALYQDHAETEESMIFPLAAAALTPDELRAMGAEMAQRRGAKVAP